MDELLDALERHAEHLRSSGERTRRRRHARNTWVLEELVERYGSLGLERLGGLDAAKKRIDATSGSALEVTAALHDQIALEP